MQTRTWTKSTVGAAPTARSIAKRRRTSARSRRPVIIGAAAVLALALIVAMPRVFSMTLTPPAVEYVEVTVARGETLWDIALQHKPRRTDTRSMVHRIRTVNELADATVYPGQVLRVPSGKR